MAKALNSLPIGAKIKDSNTKYYGKPIIFQVIDKNHSGYPANSVTLLTDKIITLKAFDAKESGGDSNRQSFGNNRYLHSNIRQWLNKDTTPWYVSQHSYDQPPNETNVWSGYNEYSLDDGFLSGFSNELKAKLIPTSLTVAKNTVTDGSGSETVQDKVFLLSETEVGLGNENGVVEGIPFSIFNSDTARRAYPTTEAVSKNYYTDTNLKADLPWYWWLRTPNAGSSHSARNVNSSGSLNNNSAFIGYYGVRPALNLPSDILVSDVPDSDGAYVIQWNATPTISGQDGNLGEKSASFSVNYIVNDTDSADALAVTEKVDSTVIRTINNAVRNQTYSVDLSNVWSQLALGNHTITITVDDGKGASSTRTYTFTKTDDRIIVRGKNPIQTSLPAGDVVVSGIVKLAAGATIKVEVCNNGFDASPTWEDATAAFLSKEAFKFTNAAKTASNWGVNFCVTLLKNNAAEKSYIEALGINFGRG